MEASGQGVKSPQGREGKGEEGRVRAIMGWASGGRMGGLRLEIGVLMGGCQRMWRWRDVSAGSEGGRKHGVFQRGKGVGGRDMRVVMSRGRLSGGGGLARAILQGSGIIRRATNVDVEDRKGQGQWAVQGREVKGQSSYGVYTTQTGIGMFMRYSWEGKCGTTLRVCLRPHMWFRKPNHAGMGEGIETHTHALWYPIQEGHK